MPELPPRGSQMADQEAAYGAGGRWRRVALPASTGCAILALTMALCQALMGDAASASSPSSEHLTALWGWRDGVSGRLPVLATRAGSRLGDGGDGNWARGGRSTPAPTLRLRGGGVPKFWRWLSERYPMINKVHARAQGRTPSIKTSCCVRIPSRSQLLQEHASTPAHTMHCVEHR